jgi:F420H(2)-dependent quinone reductase
LGERARGGDGDLVAVVGQGGEDEEPQWVANVEAGSGETTIGVGDRTLRAKTTVVRSTSPEWQRLYGVGKAYRPDAAQYETRTSRKFPIVRLDSIA